MVDISFIRHYLKFIFLITGILMALVFAGCDDNDSYYDHVPPAGQGSLVVDNGTGDDISVYIDGVRMTGVDDGDAGIIDLAPGVYRLVLDSDHSERSYRADMDILQNRLTIMEVWPSSANNYYYYDVVTTYD
ncbi:MAG: hypothetical protein PHR77_04285 [Kiritimatiellae bacterium]|nr:hypothetical protein [Kiritimatiellia bacterium]MDD5521406.1 hypothetical protein [Kiritimatiellia bacterium]